MLCVKFPEACRSFLHGAKLGWKLARNDPKKATNIISRLQQSSGHIDRISEQFRYLFSVSDQSPIPYEGVWPFSEHKMIATMKLLLDHGTIHPDFDCRSAFTNRFLVEST